MTWTDARRAAGATPDWPQLGPAVHAGPTPTVIGTLARPDQAADLTDALREYASRHSDTAWVHPAPCDPKTSLPNLSQDLLDAIAVVGLSEPRAVGERHLLRPLTHLVHGTVRHLIVDDANLLAVDALDALHEAALISGVHIWLIFETSPGPARQATPAATHAWMSDVATLISPTALLHEWRHRPASRSDRACVLPPHGHWHQSAPPGPWVGTCCVGHAGARAQVDCFLGRARRALTAGHTTAVHVRNRLGELLDHPDTTADHRWALTDAGRDIYTPGMDALGHTHPRAQKARLADVTPDGAEVYVGTGNGLDGPWVDVAPRHRPAVARLRTSRRLAGCVASDPIDGVFDDIPG